MLLLAVCAAVCDCDEHDAIAQWGEAHLAVLRRHLPYHHGVPGGCWLTLLLNRIDPGLFAQVLTDWVRHLARSSRHRRRRRRDVAAQPRPCRRHAPPPLHMVSAFATAARLVLGQEGVPDKAGENTAIPILLERLGERGGLKGAIVSIVLRQARDECHRHQRHDHAARSRPRCRHRPSPAVKANQPDLLGDVESLFAQAPAGLLDTPVDTDGGHRRSKQRRIEQRRVHVAREVDWLDGGRLFPGEMRLPDAACLMRVRSRTELKQRCRFETR